MWGRVVTGRTDHEYEGQVMREDSHVHHTELGAGQTLAPCSRPWLPAGGERKEEGWETAKEGKKKGKRERKEGCI